jgi:PAS domain S-box-containing protein
MNLSNKENFFSPAERIILLHSLARQVKVRRFLLPGFILFALLFSLALPGFPNRVLGVSLIFFSFSLFFFFANYAKKTSRLLKDQIYRLLASIFVLEILSAWFGFYLIAPVLIYYSFPLFYIAALFFVFYLIFNSSLIEIAPYQTFFYSLAWLGLTFLSLLENSDFLLSYEYYPLPTEYLSSIPTTTFTVILSGAVIFATQLIVNYTHDRSGWITRQLKTINGKLQDRLGQRNTEAINLRRSLREVKQTLETRSRTWDRQTKQLIQTFRQTIEQKEKIEGKGQREQVEELKKTSSALLNILEDTEKSRLVAEREKEKTMAVINNFVDGLLIVDEDNVIKIVNKKIEQMFGIRSSDIIESNLSEWRSHSLLSSILDLILGAQDSLKIISKAKISLGKNQTIEISVIALRRQSQAINYLIIFRDISREILVQQMKTSFVSVAAHQLRTPLSAIKWSIKMLLDGEEGDLNSEQKDLLFKTYESNQRMIRLVNDLLNVSRIEEGRFLYDIQKTNLRDLIIQITRNHQLIIERKKLKFSFHGARRDFPDVKIDAEKMKLVIQNLLSNAINYTPSGGSIISNLSQDDDSLLFSIKDTGIGIPKAQQIHIFKRFYRTENAISMVPNGTGLGLFIARNVIQAHGGKIWLSSKEGKGTTFFFTIPLRSSISQTS